MNLKTYAKTIVAVLLDKFVPFVLFFLPCHVRVYVCVFW